MTKEFIFPSEEEMYIMRPFSDLGPPADFVYHDMRPDGSNELDSNLTELSASYQYFQRGFMAHRDWIAHAARYLHVARFLGIEKKTVLDVGCGRFDMPYALLQYRKRPSLYWGLDLRAQEQWAEMIRWPIPTRLVRGDIVLDDFNSLPEWPAKGFDVVTCFEVFEHVPRSHAPVLMQRLYDWTKVGGTCYFSTPNLGVSRSVAKNHIGPDGEIREWMYQDKIDLAESIGFEIVETFGTFAVPNKLPKEEMANPVIDKIRRYLNPEMFSAFIAGAFPEYSNNSLFVMKRSK